MWITRRTPFLSGFVSLGFVCLILQVRGNFEFLIEPIGLGFPVPLPYDLFSSALAQPFIPSRDVIISSLSSKVLIQLFRRQGPLNGQDTPFPLLTAFFYISSQTTFVVVVLNRLIYIRERGLCGVI